MLLAKVVARKRRTIHLRTEDLWKLLCEAWEEAPRDEQGWGEAAVGREEPCERGALEREGSQARAPDRPGV